MKYYIYAHINKINKKIYIGQTKENLERRWRKNGEGYKKCPLFWKAIQKYGWDNFEHKIIEIVYNKNEANEKEKYWIKYYNSFGENGYNLTPGGDNYMEDLWKDKNYCNNMKKSFSKNRKEKFKNKEYKEKRLKPMLEGIQKSWNDENWKKNRIASILGDKNPNSKKVINLETGKIFLTINDAAKWCGLKSVSGIGQCCIGKRKSSGKNPITGEKLHWAYYKKGGD